MKNATHIAIVLDRSGSMTAIRNDTIGGLNHFIAEQKKVPGECTFSLVQFSDQGILVTHQAVPIATVPALTEADYQPAGWTPLYDAIGRTIVSTGEFLEKQKEADRPDKVIFVVMTDGHENASHQYNQARIREMIKHQTDTYQWQFVFLGANIDSYAVGGNISVGVGNTMNFAMNTASVASAFQSTAENAVLYRTASKRDMSYEKKHLDAQIAAGADQTH